MNLRWKLAQWLELKWWKQYLKEKTKEEYLEWKQKYWKVFLEKTAVSVDPEDFILDVGCGPAGVFMMFPDNHVDAVDPLVKKYDSEIEHFNKSEYPNIHFHSLAFEEFQKGKGAIDKYDKVFCINAINHVSDLKTCLMILAKVTKQGGQLIISIDTHNFIFFKYLFRLVPGDALHPQQHDLNEYQDMIVANGFTLLKTILYKKEFFFNYNIIIAEKK